MQTMEEKKEILEANFTELDSFLNLILNETRTPDNVKIVAREMQQFVVAAKEFAYAVMPIKPDAAKYVMNVCHVMVVYPITMEQVTGYIDKILPAAELTSLILGTVFDEAEKTNTVKETMDKINAIMKG